MSTATPPADIWSPYSAHKLPSSLGTNRALPPKIGKRVSASDPGLSLQFWNDMEVLDLNRSQLRDHRERKGIDFHALHRVEIAFDELVTNIVRYGYADQLPHRIGVVADNHITLIFHDDGREFDPCPDAAKRKGERELPARSNAPIDQQERARCGHRALATPG